MRKALATASICIGLTGCGIASVSPIVPQAAARMDSRLLGTWTDSAGEESAVITEDSSHSYLIVYTDDNGKTGRYGGRLGHIGRYDVLDLSPYDEAAGATDLSRDLVVAVHTAAFIDSIGPVVRFAFLSDDSVKAMLRRDPTAVPHVNSEDRLLLSGSTAEVQRFLARLLQRKGVLAEQNLWRRKSR